MSDQQQGGVVEQPQDPEPERVTHQPSSRHRSYRTGVMPTDLEPVTFDVNGEVFACHPWVPGAIIAEYGTYMSSNRVELSAMALLSLYNHVMDPAEAKRFLEFIYSPDNLVDLEVLGNIFSGLMEEYAQRPLVKQPNSGSGPGATGDSSTGAASSPARI